MARERRNTTGRPLARKAAKYTILNVSEPAELMDFIMKKMVYLAAFLAIGRPVVFLLSLAIIGYLFSNKTTFST